MSITFDEYDTITEKFEKINVLKLWPTPEQYNMMEKNPDKWVLYLCYLSENNDPPETEEEKASKKKMHAFLNKYLQLVD